MGVRVAVAVAVVLEKEEDKKVKCPFSIVMAPYFDRRHALEFESTHRYSCVGTRGIVECSGSASQRPMVLRGSRQRSDATRCAGVRNADPPSPRLAFYVSCYV